ncbi:alpha/beta fold hydrolase [Streptococcus oricebi]|uniref:Alpha/beta hydrolase n=1 Tax=Streptococcus oricebi TaxID=1547447 RepID=A0ABS5B3C4_9STRE|nr:alpha/beta hydrolase [Streptococcus oricebi]MBP2623337.1 alpha/beta hydrolase [Streptococcus oricebi]
MSKAGKKRKFLKTLALIIGIFCCIYTLMSLVFPSPQLGHFKTASGQETYLKYYDQVMEKMPLKPNQVYDLKTTWGTVRLYEWSRPETKQATPLMLFPGRSSGAPMWEKNIPYFARNHPVYAFDMLGDAGKSLQSLPFKNMKEVAASISQLLDQLAIKKAHLLGHSFGSAIAAAFAKFFPGRVQSLTLLEPAFTLNYPSLSVFFWGSLSQLKFLPKDLKNKALAEISGEDPKKIASNQDPLAQMIKAATDSYSTSLPTPKPLSEAELKSWTFPVYLGLAEKSSVTKEETQKNAKAIPQVTIKKWEKTTHSLPMEVAEPLAHELEDFWQKAEK